MGLFDFLRAAPVATVAINMRPVSGPWGGSSPFVQQLRAFLRQRGYGVRFDLNQHVDAIIVIDPREDLQHKSFGMAEIERYKAKNPRVRVIHRVNECDQRKGTDFMDRLLADANRHADFTIFISEWLRQYHAERWFDRSKPNAVIYNGASPRIFHPINGVRFDSSGRLVVVTHHWSNNPLKGFDVYDAVDKLIAGGEIKGVDLWVIGRWPKDVVWKAARTMPPAGGGKLASLLRQCHLYITATRWEPCGMHHIEGAQCGLPLVYHRDGGGVVEAGERYGIGFAGNVKDALLEARERYSELRGRLFSSMPSGDRMCLEYADVIQGLIANRA
jgi:glycosyltransferase involved in cell wall biosynthesis